jgi:two-component system sensor histidine kinase KdpD
MATFQKLESAGRGVLGDCLEALGVLAVVTVFGVFAGLNYHTLGYIFLLAIIAVSMRVRRWPAIFAAVVGSLSWDFVFVPPRFSFSILHVEDSLLLSCYLVVALIGSQLKALRSADDRARLLAESERMHQTLLDSVSHELKTPIAVLRAAVEQLDTADAEKRGRLTREIPVAVHRLENLVNNLLNQTRLESGVLRPHLDWCDARDLVAAAVRSVGTRLEGREVVVRIPADLPIFLADAALMEQVIANLLLNAAIHTPAPGAIRVSAGSGGEASRIHITVSDEGPGISAEVRGRIFEKFNRGHAPRSGGLGLGLSIVRGFMNAQGGDVTVEAPAGGGARFKLSLPLTAPGDVPNG